MLTARSLKARLRPADEKGAVLFMTALVMFFVLVAAAYAIDTAIWFVHHRHLQTQADAAALAASQDFQFPCDASVDTALTQRVHQYDGTGMTALSPTYNPQVSVAPTPSSTYSSSAHNLISLVNQTNYVNQTGNPGDTGMTGSPCADSAVDVKLTETNLRSFLPPLVSPSYIDAHARVSIEQETTATNTMPFAEPLPTPNAVQATLIDESNGTALGTASLTPNADHTTWSATGVPTTFSDAGSPGSFPVGLRIGMGGGATATTCGAGGVTCFDSGSSNGIAYTRVWSNTGSPGLPLATPVAPQAGHVWLTPSGTACGAGPSGTLSNFFSSSSGTAVQLCANMVFTSTNGTALNCTNSSLTLTYGATAVAIPCPSGGPNGTWTSAAVTVPAGAASTFGPTDFTMGWKVTAGKKPAGATGGDASGNCTTAANNSCSGSFGVVQRTFVGAYDSQTSIDTADRSGTILGAAVTDSTGNEILSTPRSTTGTSVNITINVLGFQNATAIPSAPLALSFGGSQANAALGCGNNGGPAFTAAVVSGCSIVYGIDTVPGTAGCPGSNPVVCAKENPGNGKLDKLLDDAMNTRINGSKNAGCTNPNHWASPNTVRQVVSQSPPDVRMITLIVADYGALSNGSADVPIRTFANFYVTGWAGDPCISQPNGTSNGLAYTHDDGTSDPGVLLGHFVKYVATSSTGTGSGKCTQNTLGNCIAVLTK